MARESGSPAGLEAIFVPGWLSLLFGNSVETLKAGPMRVVGAVCFGYYAVSNLTSQIVEE